MPLQRFRVRFAKKDELRMLSHRDLMRLLERVFRRASLPLAMSQGFHPHAKLSLPSALAVGIAALDEVLEVALESPEPISADDLLARAAGSSPAGLDFLSVEPIPAPAAKPRVREVTLTSPVPESKHDELRRSIAEFMRRSSHVVTREPNHKRVDIRPHVSELTLRDGLLEMRLTVTPEMAVRPREVLAALGIPDLESQGSCLTRTKVELQS